MKPCILFQGNLLPIIANRRCLSPSPWFGSIRTAMGRIALKILNAKFETDGKNYFIIVNFVINCGKVFASKLCVCHDSYAVETCAKLCGDMIALSLNSSWFYFNELWIAWEKSQVEWAAAVADNEARTSQLRPPDWLAWRAGQIWLPWHRSI